MLIRGHRESKGTTAADLDPLTAELVALFKRFTKKRRQARASALKNRALRTKLARSRLVRVKGK